MHNNFELGNRAVWMQTTPDDPITLQDPSPDISQKSNSEAQSLEEEKKSIRFCKERDDDSNKKCVAKHKNLMHVAYREFIKVGERVGAPDFSSVPRIFVVSLLMEQPMPFLEFGSSALDLDE